MTLPREGIQGLAFHLVPPPWAPAPSPIHQHLLVGSLLWIVVTQALEMLQKDMGACAQQSSEQQGHTFPIQLCSSGGVPVTVSLQGKCRKMKKKMWTLCGPRVCLSSCHDPFMDPPRNKPLLI